MPAYPDPNSPRVQKFVARLVRMTDEEWRRVALRYDRDSESVMSARDIVTEIVHGIHLHITEAQRRARGEMAQDALRLLDGKLEPFSVPEGARDAARDALWAILVFDDLQGEREWARRTLLAPFAEWIPFDT